MNVRSTYDPRTRLRVPLPRERELAEAQVMRCEAALEAALSALRPMPVRDGLPDGAVLAEHERDRNRSQPVIDGRPLYDRPVTRGLIERINSARLALEAARTAERLAFEASRNRNRPQAARLG